MAGDANMIECYDSSSSEDVSEAGADEAARAVVHQGVFTLEGQFEVAGQIEVETAAEVGAHACVIVVVFGIPAVKGETYQRIDVEPFGQAEGEVYIGREYEGRLALVPEDVTDFRGDAHVRGHGVLEIEVHVTSVVMRCETAGNTKSLFAGLGESRCGTCYEQKGSET